MKPVLLDLYCGAGGCTRGYQEAGFHVVGVDIFRQPRYCGDEFVQDDVFSYLEDADLSRFAAIHASPPCQGYTRARHLQGNEHPMLVADTRASLVSAGKRYVIENVIGAPLVNPIKLTGTMFGLLTVRPRLFECNFPVPQPEIPDVSVKHAKMGRPPKEGEYVHVIGHFSGIDYCRKAMGIDWMTGKELAESIPPAYTRYIGDSLMRDVVAP